MEKILYLDLDGVFVNFIDGWMDHYVIMDRKPVAKWNFGEDYGLNRVDFYKSITSLPISFWSNLKPATWSTELFRSLKEKMDDFGVEKIMFLSHSVSESCRIGKQLWVNKHFPELGESLITVSDSKLKSRFANENCTLIDDKFQNCVDFSRAGGKSWLFARPWNRGAVPCEKKGIVFFPFSTVDDSDCQYSNIWARGAKAPTKVWHYNSHEYEAVLEPVTPTKRTALVDALLKGDIDE